MLPKFGKSCTLDDNHSPGRLTFFFLRLLTMTELNIKYSTYSNAILPRPIRIESLDLGNEAQKRAEGSDGQPSPCQPFFEAATYGLELVYQHETVCNVVNDNGNLRFEWDWANEPGGGLTGGEFVPFAPRLAPKYYLFNTRLDIQAPPGQVIRSVPHPRFFTDTTGTVPQAMIGHVQTEWYPRLFFVVFRAPRPGRRHIFRKGEPYTQVLFVPQQRSYETISMQGE